MEASAYRIARDFIDHRPARLGLAAGADSLDIVRRLLRDVHRHLTASGIVVVEIGHNGHESGLRTAYRGFGPRALVDVAGPAGRLVSLRARPPGTFAGRGARPVAGLASDLARPPAPRGALGGNLGDALGGVTFSSGGTSGVVPVPDASHSSTRLV